MTKQRQLAERLAAECSVIDPSCSVVAFGSVGRGDERSESDLDLMVLTELSKLISDRLTWDEFRGGEVGDEIPVRVHHGRIDGIGVDVHSCTPQNRLAVVRDIPHISYGEVLILRDPTGVAGKCKETACAYFAAHPDIAAAFAEQERELLRHKMDAGHDLAFPERDGFLRHVEKRFGLGKVKG
jgi:hypothetical protein